jgi:hypothetical protein
MSFIWFWTFWHWSKESFREEALLRSPLQGIGGHWDEWFRHEASECDQIAIAKTGQTESSQRQFLVWLRRHWVRESGLPANRLTQNFVLGQLAQVQPFNQWAVFEKYGNSYGLNGISAVILTEKSLGEPDDVRLIEALALPADATAPAVVAEGFQAESSELETPRRAAMSLLRGKGFLVFLAFWIAGGQRPYPSWLKIALNLGWMAVAVLILYLLMGPEPGEQLFWMCSALVALWGGLILAATIIAGALGIHAWRQGRKWCMQFEQIQVRLRMNGGLIIKGGSAGLPFCLNTLLSLYRLDAHSMGNSWLWQRLFHRLHLDANAWAATGVITNEGYLKPVVVEPKLRACLQSNGIKNILTPRQAGTGRSTINRIANSLITPHHESAPVMPSAGKTQFGFAAEEHILNVHPCRHVAQALMCLGKFTSPGQLVTNAFAIAVSCVMLFALPSLRGILLPPPAPIVVPPFSPSPDYLWVSLDTKHPQMFQVVLESSVWSNRRAKVVAHSGSDGSMRAEILLRPLDQLNPPYAKFGTVWIERRYKFLTREFAPGERVGRYSLSYFSNLGYE